MTVNTDVRDTQHAGLDDIFRRHAFRFLRERGAAAADDVVRTSPRGVESSQRKLAQLVERGMSIVRERNQEAPARASRGCVPSSRRARYPRPHRSGESRKGRLACRFWTGPVRSYARAAGWTCRDIGGSHGEVPTVTGSARCKALKQRSLWSMSRTWTSTTRSTRSEPTYFDEWDVMKSRRFTTNARHR